MNNLNRDSWSVGWQLNRGAPEYNTAEQTTWDFLNTMSQENTTSACQSKLENAVLIKNNLVYIFAERILLKHWVSEKYVLLQGTTLSGIMASLPEEFAAQSAI